MATKTPDQPAPKPAPKPEAKAAPAIDKVAPAPKQTTAVVMAMSALQNTAGRLNRLRALARTNRDVAWAMTQNWTKPASSKKEP